ncbi:hypothetical protein, partial [Pseudomonas sp. F01002]|uniref:hypothetical protein n=1 Tax=Pseudomonas sp. F01002 TaxID=2555724 RepID=UPI001C4994A8
ASSTRTLLLSLSTIAGTKISNPSWVIFQSAGWVSFQSAPTVRLQNENDVWSEICWFSKVLPAPYGRSPTMPMGALSASGFSGVSAAI